jgi:quercetin dioxygenase-like cupin family protein
MKAKTESNMMKRTATTIETSLSPILAQMLVSLEPVAPSPARARAIKKDIMQKVAATKRAIEPTIVRNALSAEAIWTRITSTIDCQVLFDNGATSAHLVRFAAGGISPGHRHDHDEAAMVMQGWCMVGDMRLNTGDYHMVPAGASHGDIVSPEGCVLFLHGPSYAAKSQNQGASARA